VDSAGASLAPALNQRAGIATITKLACLAYVEDEDVRDVGGRLGRLIASIFAGVLLSLMLAALLPGLHRIGGGPSAFAIPALLAAGACGFAVGIYTLLGALERREPMRAPRCVHAPLPRARLVRRR